MTLTKKVRGSSETDSPGGVGARISYSGDFLTGVARLTSNTTWQKDFDEGRSEYATTTFPKLLAVQRKRAGNMVEGRAVVGSVQPLAEKPLNKMLTSKIEDDGGQRFRLGTG